MVYKPVIPTNITSVEELRRVVESELLKLVGSLPEQEEIVLSPMFAAPPKPRDGMIVYADGASWNPGAGAGTYERRGGAWIKL